MEDPTVVLLAVGEDSGVLAEEIEKKGLHVVTCAFSEAEETIEENDPLLIVLHGSRGAVELSTLLEDSPSGRAHKVAVVAPRKELAQLMGLNREIVVGLIAVEMTEKTAAARVEALVRQNAKQRGIAINLAARRMSLGPRPSVAGRSSPPASKEPLILGAPTPGLGSGSALLDLVAEVAASAKQTGTPATEAPPPPDFERGARDKDVAAAAQKPSKFAATTAESPGAPRQAGETAIGLPQAAPKPSPSRHQRPRDAAAEPDYPARVAASPPPLTPVPPDGRTPTAGTGGPAKSEFLSQSILESIPAEPFELEEDALAKVPAPQAQAPEPRPRNIKKTLVGVAAPPLGAPRPAAPAEPPAAKVDVPAQIDWGAIDSIVPESLSPSEMDSVAPGDAPEVPQVPRAGALPEFDPSELLADLPLADLSAGDGSSPVVSVGPTRSWLDEAAGLPLVGMPPDEGDSLDGDVDPPFALERGPSGGEPLVAATRQDDGPPTPRVDLSAMAGGKPFVTREPASDLSGVLPTQDEDTPGGADGHRPPESDDWGGGPWGRGRSDSLPFGATMAEPVTSPLRSNVAELPGADDEPPLPPEATIPPPAVEPDAAGESPEEAWGEDPVVAASVPGSQRGEQAEDTPARPSSSKTWLAAAALLIAGGGTAAYFFLGQPAGTRPAGEPVELALPDVEPRGAATVSKDSAESDAGVGEVAVGAEPENPPRGADDAPAADAAQSDSAAPDAAAPDAAAPDVEGAEPAAERAGDQNAAAAPLAPGVGSQGPKPGVDSIALVDNPFKTPDAGLAGCAELAPDAKAETRDPVTEASTHWAVARKLIVKGDFKGASQAMCMAVAINPQSPANEGLARLYVLGYSPAAAMPWVEKALALAPDDRELINLRGDVLSQLGQQEDATAEWLRALSLTPEDQKRRESQARDYVGRARQHRSRGDLPKAEQFFRRALGLEPLNVTALAGMADVLLARGLVDHAGTFAVRSLEVFEAIPEVHLVLGDVALAKKQPDAARASYQRALAIRPDFWPAKTRLRELP